MNHVANTFVYNGPHVFVERPDGRRPGVRKRRYGHTKKEIAAFRRQAVRASGYRGLCFGCLRVFHLADMTIDHIRPLSKGGDPWAIANQQLLCKPCNTAKWNSWDGISGLPKLGGWKRREAAVEAAWLALQHNQGEWSGMEAPCA